MVRADIILKLILIAIPVLVAGCKSKSNGSNNGIGQQVMKISDEIWTIFQDSRGHYWFGSNGDGVFHFDGKLITNYTSKDGLVSDQLRGIQEDGSGNLYFDTPLGVSRFDGQSITTIPRRQLRDAEWKMNETDLWFNGNGELAGVLRYHDDSLSFLPLPTQDLAAAFGIHTCGVGQLTNY